MREPPFEPEHVVAALDAHRVRYVIVGGLAVGVHGVVRATRDLDLVPDPEGANLDRLAVTLTDIGGGHPMGVELTGLTLARPASMKVLTRHGEVHVLNRMPGTPDFAQLFDARLLVRIAPGVDAPVCSLAHLRQMKSASLRPRDRVDLTELDEIERSA